MSFSALRFSLQPAAREEEQACFLVGNNFQASQLLPTRAGNAGVNKSSCDHVAMWSGCGGLQGQGGSQQAHLIRRMVKP